MTVFALQTKWGKCKLSCVRKLTTDIQQGCSTMNKSLRTSRRLILLATLFALPVAAGTSRIYVTNHAETTISVIDPATNKIVQELKGIEAPEGVNFSADGKLVYATQTGEDVLTVMDRKSGKVVKKVPLSGIANDV